MIKFKIRKSCYTAWPEYTRTDTPKEQKYVTHHDVDSYVERAIGNATRGVILLDLSEFDGATRAVRLRSNYRVDEIYHVNDTYQVEDARPFTLCRESLMEFFGKVPKEFWLRIDKEEA